MKKTPVWQIVLLVVLLGVLAIAMFKAISGALAPKRPAGQANAAPAQQQQKATDMPDVVPTTSQGRLGEKIDAEAKASRSNPNLFKVYQVKPQKNPFVQDKDWYTDKLDEIPGYPELADSDYFDSMDPYLPDIGFIFDDPNEWGSVSVRRGRENKYTISGTSKDGLINTQINLEKDIPTDQTYAWKKGSKVPLSAMKNPDWVKEQVRKGIMQSLPEENAENQSLFDENGLPIPGMETTGAAGDTFTCYGVSAKGTKSSALILYNGAPRIVTEGMVLPTHYQVLQINADGVVLVDVKTGESTFVPLGGEPGTQ